MMVSKGRNYI